jgi:hypothetical protein
MKQYYDQGHRDVALAVRHWAWLRLHQCSTTGITDKSVGKLAPWYFGPYRVLERVDVAYRLKRPPRAKIHDVFHMVFLKGKIGLVPSKDRRFREIPLKDLRSVK